MVKETTATARQRLRNPEKHDPCWGREVKRRVERQPHLVASTAV
jgi:hypothetical protein